MKNKLPLLLIPTLAFTSCEKKSESVATSPPPSTPPPVEIPAGSFNPALANVISHLDTNGAHLSVTHIDQDIQTLAKAIDSILDVARKSSDEIPPNLDVVKLLNEMGLGKIDAVGKSSRKLGSAWHNRAFLQTDGSPKGLLGLMGDKGSPWTAAQFAPADADIAVEFEINLRHIYDSANSIKSSFGKDAESEIEKAMTEKIVGGVMSLGDVFGKTDLRATIIVSIDREKTWKPDESVELPTIDAAICLERGMWLWKQFGEEIEKNTKVTSSDGLKIIKAPEAMETPMGALEPVIVLDEAKDLIWISLNEAYLEKCRSSENKLSSSADFKLATTGFPEKGNGLFYVSKDLCDEVMVQIQKMSKELPLGGEEKVVTDLVKDLFNISKSGNFSQGYAWSLSTMKSGILVVANSPFADKGYGLTSGIVPIASMASLTAPMVIRQRNKAMEIEQMELESVPEE